MEDIIDLENKVCIITGVGKGIGYETAILLKNQGVKLGLITRDKRDLKKLLQVLDVSDSDVYYQAGDVSDEDTVKSFVSKVFTKFERIDVLINNAGIRFRKEFLKIEYKEWQNVMNVNAGSTFLFCREVGKYMVKQKSGSIINIASIIGTLGLPELAGYGASKGAIISLTKTLALEWSEYGIKVNAIAPGFCNTSYADSFKKNNELYNFTLERIPMKRWGMPIDVGNTCVYLASNMSAYVTGEVISVDGGWSAW
jgi:NAD(P)-dependent dehydrogenase (short-subunit alcohol dehydrogenase family)